MIRLTVQGPGGTRALGGSRSEILVGSRKDADVALDDDAVGGAHCLLRAEGDGYRLVDLGGPGGVRLNGRPVREASLSPGDAITLGSHRIVVDAVGAPPPLALAVPSPAPLPAPSPPKHAAPPSEFEREIRELLRRAPWWAVSFVTHLILLFLLTLLSVDVKGPPASAVVRAAGSTKEPLPEDRALPEVDTAAPEVEAPDAADPLAEILSEPTSPEGGSPEEPTPPDRSAIGAGPDWLRHRFPKRQPFNPRKDQPGSPVAPQASDRAHAAAARTVEARLGGEVGRIRARLGADHLVVVKGDYDNIEHVLEAFGLPCLLLDRPELLKRALRADQILFINCALPPPDNEQAPYVRRVREFVRRGGWLMTSDWAIDPYVTAGFAREVGARLKSDGRYQPDVIVDAQFCAGAGDHPLVKDIFAGRERAPWWIEKASSFFTLQNGSDAMPLVRSEDLDAKYGAPVIAFTYTAPNGGRIAHLLGHFHQKTEHADGIAGMQHLILNFVRMKYPSTE